MKSKSTVLLMFREKMLYELCLWVVLFVSLFKHGTSSERSFIVDYENDQFLKDGKPFRYISGGIHYFRVPEMYWEDRLYKIRKSGCNAIQTYVPWNIHEPYYGQYENLNKLVNFIKIAQKHDLLVILRPGPYICAEWEFGGFPYWLLKNSTMKLRTSDKGYLNYVDNWLSKLLSILRPHLYVNGGPIIMMQVENEYGSYGCDHEYINLLESMFRKYLGDDVVLFTTDGAADMFLICGATKTLYTTIDFGAGGDPAKTFLIQRKYQPHGPYVNSEYYTGWLDHWGQPHQKRSAAEIAVYVDKILAANASMNMYMFEGGTNFAFMNGANEGIIFQPQPTSYDYDAPLSEAGDPTPKYFAIQKVLAKYVEIPAGPQPKPTIKKAYGRVDATAITSLFTLLQKKKPVNNLDPIAFEDLDIPYGYVLYRTNISSKDTQESSTSTLTLKRYHDRAHVFINQVLQGILDINNPNHSIEITSGSVLDILVENQGRVNFGPFIQYTKKGIIDDVLLNGEKLVNWDMYSINGTELSNERSFVYDASKLAVVPSALLFTFDATDVEDTYLKLDMWTKGFVLLNGVNLGRYWTPKGPQKTLYVPKVYLKSNNNVLIICETDKLPLSYLNHYVEFVDSPVFT